MYNYENKSLREKMISFCVLDEQKQKRHHFQIVS